MIIIKVKQTEMSHNPFSIDRSEKAFSYSMMVAALLLGSARLQACPLVVAVAGASAAAVVVELVVFKSLFFRVTGQSWGTMRK